MSNSQPFAAAGVRRKGTATSMASRIAHSLRKKVQAQRVGSVQAMGGLPQSVASARERGPWPRGGFFAVLVPRLYEPPALGRRRSSATTSRERLMSIPIRPEVSRKPKQTDRGLQFLRGRRPFRGPQQHGQLVDGRRPPRMQRKETALDLFHAGSDQES